MKIKLDANNYLIGYCTVGDIEDSIYIDAPENFNESLYYAYRLENGILVFDNDKFNNIVLEKNLNNLRQRRSDECFGIINRGMLWYQTLSQAQFDELQLWYIEWLNVTETMIVPQKPSWLL